MANIGEIVKELKEERERLDRAISALTMLDGSRITPSGGVSRTRRTLSAAARRKIAAAQRARWAKVKSGRKTQSTPKASHRRVVSAAARRKMAAAQRARWARVRTAQTKKAA